MPQASCLCGAVKFTVPSGPPIFNGICHCSQCRKVSGSVYTLNVGYPRDSVVKTTDAPLKSYTWTSSGNGAELTISFCPACSCTLWSGSGKTPGMLVVKTGLVDGDDRLEAWKPGVELFPGQRVAWLGEVEGCAQMESLPQRG